MTPKRLHYHITGVAHETHPTKVGLINTVQKDLFVQIKMDVPKQFDLGLKTYPPIDKLFTLPAGAAGRSSCASLKEHPA